jgi:ABC-type nitrate/sulfonate/bicarbonate transport system substrate-binding protein
VAGYGTWLPVVKLATAGEPIQVLASMALALAQNLVVNKNTIRSKDDLKGKKWAVDGIGALSHSLGLLICKGLGIEADDIEWVVAGPPPERKAQLLDGRADCSLLRVEEAIALTRDKPDLLAKLLGFEEIQPLAPVQPHGILSVRSDWAQEHPDDCKALVKGLILASRSLHDDVENFRKAVRDHVHHVTVTDEDIDLIWAREKEAKSFAVNGGFGSNHWSANYDMYKLVNAGAVPRPFEEVSVPGVVEDALREVGCHRSHDPAPGSGGLCAMQ